MGINGLRVPGPPGDGATIKKTWVTRKERNQQREKHFIEEDIFHCYWKDLEWNKQGEWRFINGTMERAMVWSLNRINQRSRSWRHVCSRAFLRSLQPPSKSLDCNHYSYQNRQYIKDLRGATGPILLAREEHDSWTNYFPICRLEESASTPSFTKCQFIAVWDT
jgi:hypothetical protein